MEVRSSQVWVGSLGLLDCSVRWGGVGRGGGGSVSAFPPLYSAALEVWPLASPGLPKARFPLHNSSALVWPGPLSLLVMTFKALLTVPRYVFSPPHVCRCLLPWRTHAPSSHLLCKRQLGCSPFRKLPLATLALGSLSSHLALGKAAPACCSCLPGVGWVSQLGWDLPSHLPVPAASSRVPSTPQGRRRFVLCDGDTHSPCFHLYSFVLSAQALTCTCPSVCS